MAETRPAGFAGFLVGMAIPKAQLGDMVEQMMLHGCSMEQIGPLLNPVNGGVVPAVGGETLAALSPPARGKRAARGKKIADMPNNELVARFIEGRQPRPVTRKEVMALLERKGRSPDAAGQVMNRLKTQGCVVVNAPGVYTWKPESN